MNRNIIIIAVLVIVVAAIGTIAFSQLPRSTDEGMLNTEINFLSKESLKNGEAVEFELNDEKGQHLSGQNITITFVENGENQTYSVITNTEGQASLVLNNEDPGSYDVIVTYNGTLRFNGCVGKQTITIEGEEAQTSNSASTESGASAPVQTNSSAGTSLYNGNSTSNSQLHYDSQYNFYYDDNGIIRGGQNDGMSADYIRNGYESGDMVDEEGNLQ